MARPASGAEHIDAAKELLRTAKTAEELRLAQAVLLPLTQGFSMQQTAAVIGRSVGATCSMRTRFMAVHAGRRAAARSKRELRNHASASLQEEARVLDKVFSGAAEGQVLVVPQLKPLIDQHLGKTLSLSSIYRMLARHGWRKLAPDTAHPQGDAQARDDWKKNSAPRWIKSAPAFPALRR